MAQPGATRWWWLYSVLVALVAAPAAAVELTGVLAYGALLDGSVGPFWHTSTVPNGRPLALTEAAPSELRGVAFMNGRDGEIDMELSPGAHLLTALWQAQAGEFPIVMMVVNLFFNGDNQTPAISAYVPSTRAFTQLSANASARTFSLYAAEVDNSAGLYFDEGALRVRLAAAFFVPGDGPTNRWRPSDFVNLDRVGMRDLLPDGLPDCVLVLEIIVAPSTEPSRPLVERQRPPAALPWFIPEPRLERVVPSAPRGDTVTPHAAPPTLIVTPPPTAGDTTTTETAEIPSPPGETTTPETTSSPAVAQDRTRTPATVATSTPPPLTSTTGRADLATPTPRPRPSGG